MDKKDFIKLGKLIIKGRNKRGLTQKQLAHKAFISSSGLSKIERGLTNPSALTIYRLGKLLDINLFSIFD